MKLYSIKNKQTVRFNPPFVARDQDDAIETCRKAIITGRDVSLLVELENLELHYVGSFEPLNAEFIDCVGNDLICCLADIPLPDHLNKMIAKLKEVKE